MDRSEWQDDAVEALRAALEGKQAEIWTALPGIIESFDPVKMTATVQPALQGTFFNEQGRAQHAALPLLVDVPVEFPAGGGFTLTFPVKPGDECIVEFQSRCLDGWWVDGAIRPALDARMHDLSDAVCRVGVRSQKRVLDPAVNTSGVQLRTDDGQAHVTMLPDYSIKAANPAASVTLSPTGEVDVIGKARVGLRAPMVEIFCGGFALRRLKGDQELTAEFDANIKQDGWIESTGDHKAGDISLIGHTHPGDSGGTTGGPN